MAEAYMTPKQIKAIKAQATRLCNEESVGWQIPIMKMGAMSNEARLKQAADIAENDDDDEDASTHAEELREIERIAHEWLDKNKTLK